MIRDLVQKVSEELLSVLLTSCRELGVIAGNDPLELNRFDAVVVGALECVVARQHVVHELGGLKFFFNFQNVLR